MDTKTEAKDREIDARVAELLGWSAIVDRGGWYDGFPPSVGNSIYNLRAVPRFSTDIAAAFEVIKHMRESGFSYAVWGVCSLSSVGMPSVAFCRSVYPP